MNSEQPPRRSARKEAMRAQLLAQQAKQSAQRSAASKSGANSGTKTTTRSAGVTSVAAKTKTKNTTSKTNAGKNRKNKGKFWNYPRKNLGPIHRWLPSWRFLLGSFFLFLSLGATLFLALYITTDVPDPDDFALAEKSSIYYADGTSELGSLATVNREVVPLEDIPTSLRNAVVASEDKTFYTNNGVSIPATIRALVNNLSGGPRQGGSTLTQQYAERYYTGTTLDYFGKLREAVLAIKIDKTQTKEEILGNYLNTIYFGRGSYGIEAAAKSYFGISASELNLPQSALLAAVIPAPSAWDPAKDLETAQLKYKRVLRRMLEDGWIKQAEHNDALANFPETIEPTVENTYAGPKGYLLDMIRTELIEQVGLTEAEIDLGGYRIHSTIDAKMQEAAVAAMAKLPAEREGTKSGLYSMNPENGEVFAVYGGEDYLVRQRNAATQDRAQAGSTFKYFAVLEALSQGIDPNKFYASPSSVEIAGKTFANYANRNYGSLNFAGMVKYSVNTGFLKLNQEIGASNTYQMALKLGLSADTPGLDENIGNLLGSSSVTPQEMARAYAVAANGGYLVTPHLIKEVRNTKGEVIYTADFAKQQVVSAEVAAAAAEIFKSPFESGGTASWVADSLDRTYAGKSGTSSGPVSAWFIGFTPQMVTAVDIFRVGEDGGEEILGEYAGYYVTHSMNYPLYIWRDYTVAAMAGMPELSFGSLGRWESTKTNNSETSTSNENTDTTEENTEKTETENNTEVEPSQETGTTDSSTSGETSGATDPTSSETDSTSGGSTEEENGGN